MIQSTRQESSVKDSFTPNLLVLTEDEFREIVRAVAEEIRAERDRLGRIQFAA